MIAPTSLILVCKHSPPNCSMLPVSALQRASKAPCALLQGRTTHSAPVCHSPPIDALNRLSGINGRKILSTTLSQMTRPQASSVSSIVRTSRPQSQTNFISSIKPKSYHDSALNEPGYLIKSLRKLKWRFYFVVWVASFLYVFGLYNALLSEARAPEETLMEVVTLYLALEHAERSNDPEDTRWAFITLAIAFERHLFTKFRMATPDRLRKMGLLNATLPHSRPELVWLVRTWRIEHIRKYLEKQCREKGVNDPFELVDRAGIKLEKKPW